jgi:membrane protease YdiL (CAAX protease family)
MGSPAAIIGIFAQTYNTPAFNFEIPARMESTQIPTSRAVIAAEILSILALLHILRLGFDQIDWRYSGPMTLAAMSPVILIMMRRRGVRWSHIGIRAISWPKGVLLFLPQALLAFFLIGLSGVGIALFGEALNIGVFTADQPDPQERWGTLHGNTSLLLTWLAILWFAGPAEELIFRGYLISRLRDALGPSFLSCIASVLLPAIIFGLGHVYYQGWRGFFVTGTIGVTLGVLFLLFKKNLWPLMIAHAAFNSMVFIGTYMGADF